MFSKSWEVFLSLILSRRLHTIDGTTGSTYRVIRSIPSEDIQNTKYNFCVKSRRNVCDVAYVQ